MRRPRDAAGACVLACLLTPPPAHALDGWPYCSAADICVECWPRRSRRTATLIPPRATLGSRRNPYEHGALVPSALRRKPPSMCTLPRGAARTLPGFRRKPYRLEVRDDGTTHLATCAASRVSMRGARLPPDCRHSMTHATPFRSMILP